MSKTIEIGSPNQFTTILHSTTVVVADFYADWCGPCKTIAPFFEQLSAEHTRPKLVAFVRVNVDSQAEIASLFQVTAMPTFLIFKKQQVAEKLQGAIPRDLAAAVKKWAAKADEDGPPSTGEGERWLGARLPKGYGDVTDQVELKGLDLLNADSDLGNGRTLFDGTKPTVLGHGKEKSTAKEKPTDWVETDTDEQLMLYIPFQSTLKIHTLLITSLPPKPSEGETREDLPMRPKTIRIYSNKAHVLGFEEAEDVTATQEITLAPEDWDKETGTAKIELRFVRFQNVTSLVVFIVDGEGDSEKVRVDRLRIIGETGEKREPGKLEKVDQGGD